MKTIHLCQLYKITFNIVWAVWQIKDKLEYTSDKNKSLTPINQLLIALRFYATGRISLLLVNDDTFSVRQQYVVQFTKVTAAIASLQPKCQVSNNKTNKNSLGDEIANVNFLTTISHTCRPTSKYRKRRVTYTVYLWLVGKRVVNFLQVIIELFSLAITVEALWADIGRNFTIWKGVDHFERKL